MARNTNYLKKLLPITEKLSEKYGISREEVEEIIDHFFLTLKKYITDPRMPKINITNLGTFKPSIGKINWQIYKTLFHYKMGHISREKAAKKIGILWPIRRRLQKEKAGESTWKEWRDKKLD